MPETEPMHDSVEFADPPFGGVTLVGFRLQVRPTDGEIESVRFTVLLKLFRLATPIVDVPTIPAVTGTMEGLALMVKSGAAPTL